MVFRTDFIQVENLIDILNEILNKLPVREYILAFDPDEAGRKATERFRKNVRGKIIKELVYPDNRDINDLQEEFLNCKIIF